MPPRAAMVAVHSCERDGPRPTRPKPQQAGASGATTAAASNQDPHSSDLFVRTSYSDAAVGLAQLDKVNITSLVSVLSAAVRTVRTTNARSSSSSPTQGEASARRT